MGLPSDLEGAWGSMNTNANASIGDREVGFVASHLLYT
jgi:hypothetical protein